MPDATPPVYRQVAQNIRDRIERGELRAGDPLPTVRELARQLGLNQNTAQRAYSVLRDEGLIGGRFSQGTCVLAGADPARVREARSAALRLSVTRFIGEQLGHGFSLAEVEAAFFGERERLAEGSQPGAPADKSTWLGLGSHDVSLDLLLAYCGRASPGERIVFATVGSAAGLEALAREKADFAAAHLLDSATGDYNLPMVQALFPGRRMALVTLALRQNGWMVHRGNPKRITSAADLARRGVRFINRQPGAGTRALLDTLLRRERLARRHVKGYARQEVTHLAVARAIAAGEADVGLGIASAAVACGLDFIPVAVERFEIILPAESALLTRLGDILARPDFQDAIRSLGGYDTSETGRIRHTSGTIPPATIPRGTPS